MPDYRVELLKSRKAVLDARRRATRSFKDLLADYKQYQMMPRYQGSGLFDLLPVKAAARLEVFVRGEVREIVNHSRTFAERSVSLLRGFKPEYDFLIEVSHETITYGDIVAHAISVSSVDQVISIFETLSGQRLETELPKVIDRWAVEIERADDRPIIDDFKKTISNVEKILRLRHKICHDAVQLTAEEEADLPVLLDSLYQLTESLNWFLLQMLHGKFPLTQTDMNLEAIELLREIEDSMQEILKKLYYLLQNQPRALKLVKTSQHAWERYSAIEAYCAHDPAGGGTIGPYVRANTATHLTKQRIEQLSQHIAFSDLP